MLYICGSCWLFAHRSHDLSLAETKKSLLQVEQKYFFHSKWAWKNTLFWVKRVVVLWICSAFTSKFFGNLGLTLASSSHGYMEKIWQKKTKKWKKKWKWNFLKGKSNWFFYYLFFIINRLVFHFWSQTSFKNPLLILMLLQH